MHFYSLIRKYTIHLSVTALLALSIVLALKFYNADLNQKPTVIKSDGNGYYSFLPAIFIHKNINAHIAEDRFYVDVNGHQVNKCHVGTAMVILPFFLNAYMCAYLFDYEVDGYSFPFQIFVCIAALFYLAIGLVFLSKLLMLSGFKKYVVVLSIFLVLFATNLLNYVVYEPSMTHVYSFCFISIFLFLVKRISSDRKLSTLLVLALVLAVIVIIRPFNIIIVLAIPFIIGDKKELTVFMKYVLTPKYLLPSLLAFILVFAFQSAVWFFQCGDILIWSYQNEGFCFSNPEIYSFLFSFRKGFFIYTPLFFVSVSGLLIMFFKNKYKLFFFLIFFASVIYFLSSWWNWYYGPSFSQRVMVDFYPVLIFLPAVLLQFLNKYLKTVFVFCLVIITALNLIQWYQYRFDIISSWDMNFNKYKYTFLKTTSQYSGVLGGNNDLMPYCNKKVLLFHTENDFENNYDCWKVDETEYFPEYQTKMCTFNNHEYNMTCMLPDGLKYSEYLKLYASVKLDRYEMQINSCSKAFFVIDVSDDSTNYFLYSFKINEIPEKIIRKWDTFYYNVEIPAVKNENAVIKMYIWNAGKLTFYVDNVDIELYGIK